MVTPIGADVSSLAGGHGVHNQLALNLSEDRIQVPVSTRAEELPVPLPVIALVGPTASGKSALAIQLALALAQHDHPAEIVNGDSMVVYRGMDIGTAKPSHDDRATVPHHLVDILDVTQSSSVALMQSRARQTFVDLRGRGVVPILVGGSALYSRAILDEMTIPPTDPAVRARLESELVEAGPHALHDRLARLDPQAAKAFPAMGVVSSGPWRSSNSRGPSPPPCPLVVTTRRWPPSSRSV